MSTKQRDALGDFRRLIDEEGLFKRFGEKEKTAVPSSRWYT
jgi:hypothetical protein